MHSRKITDLDYIQFLIAAQTAFTCTEAARCQPGRGRPGEREDTPAHDAFTRLLASQPPDTEALWAEVAPLVQMGGGLLVLDDTTLDKPYARRMELVTRHWSGKHQRVVLGINLLTLLWTDGAEGGARLPVDCRVYNKPDALQEGHTKNAHFLAMLETAKGRGFRPRYVCFDGWYSSLDNLKKVRSFGWHFLTRLKSNRLVNPEGEGSVAVADLDIPQEGRTVHLRGYGLIRVFRVVEDSGKVFDEAQHWATSDLGMTQPQREELAVRAYAIEVYHRGLKQCCGVERCQARKASAQIGHILMAVRAFVRLEAHRLRTGLSWYETKKAIIRNAVRQYLERPRVQVTSTA